MKIVIVIDSWNQGNGCIVATHRLVKELKNRGHEVSLVTTGGKEASQFEGEVTEVPGFYLPGVKQAMINMDFLFGKGKKTLLRKAYEGADLVQIQFPYFMARNAVKVAKKMGIPVLGACHVQAQNMTASMGRDNPLMDWFFETWFNFELFQQVEAIHCPSLFAADLLHSKGSRAHFRVVSNGIPREYVPLDPPPPRPAFFEDHLVLMNVGRHAMEKRQELMIEGVLRSRYKDKIKLLICGKGEDSQKLRRRGKELPVAPLVEYISNEDKHLYLNSADLYLHASTIELESLSCLEALGTGLPCLIADSPLSAASQFALDSNLLFEMDNPDDLARKIDYWFENRESLPELKKKVLQEAEKYRMDRSVDQMEKLYQDVIASAKEGRKELLPPEEKRLTTHE